MSWNFAWMFIDMLRCYMNFSGFFYGIFNLIDIFLLCWLIVQACVTHVCISCVKFSYGFGWRWNLVCWLLTHCRTSLFWSHSFLICCHYFMNFWSECLCWCYELAWIIVSGLFDFHWPTFFCPIELKIDMLYIECVLFRCEFLWN